MKTYLDLVRIVKNVQYKDWAIEVKEYGVSFYLQVSFTAPCAIKREPKVQACRKWQLSRHMTETEIVRTAFKAILAAEEHEASELFRYHGQAIFSPHMDVRLLHAACVQGLDVRQPREDLG